MKMFKYNMKFIRAARWINSKISNREKNTTLMIFLFIIIVGYYYGVIIKGL